MDAPRPLRRGPGRRSPRLLALAALLAAALFAASCQLAALEAQYGVHFVIEGQTWDAASVGAVADALNRLPPHVRSHLGNPRLGQLRFLDNPEGRTSTGWSPYGRAANFYSNYEGLNEVVLAPGQGTFTVLHELGHAYQLRATEPGKNAHVLLEPEMRDFMAATGWRLLSSDAEVLAATEPYEVRLAYEGSQVWDTISRDDPLEDYANSFALFFLDPARLQQLSPARYEWMQQAVAAPH